MAVAPAISSRLCACMKGVVFQLTSLATSLLGGQQQSGFVSTQIGGDDQLLRQPELPEN